MFHKPYRIERKVPTDITAKDVLSFGVNNFNYNLFMSFNPDGFKFIISYTQVSSFEGS